MNPEIGELLKQRQLSRYDRVALTGSERFYEEASDSDLGHGVKESPSITIINNTRYTSLGKDIICNQQIQIAQQKAGLEYDEERIDRLTDILTKFEPPQQDKEQRERLGPFVDTRFIKAEDIFKFKPAYR